MSAGSTPANPEPGSGVYATMYGELVVECSGCGERVVRSYEQITLAQAVEAMDRHLAEAH